MFRILTSLPPGMVRFTIVDPIGIGRNFGAFMHLADFDPGTGHQPGLDRSPADRGAAGRAGKPHGDRDPEVPAQRVRHDRGLQRRGRRGRRALSRAGRRRLSHQVRREGGRPAGRDRRRRRALRRARARRRRHRPRRCRPGFGLDDLRPALRPPDLDATAGWPGTIPTSARFPLALDPPPPAEFATRQIQKVGAAARDAKRVEVPFEFIAPPQDRVVDARQPLGHRRSPWARRARPSGRTWRSATEPPSTCSSPAAPGRANRP